MGVGVEPERAFLRQGCGIEMENKSISLSAKFVSFLEASGNKRAAAPKRD